MPDRAGGVHLVVASKHAGIAEVKALTACTGLRDELEKFRTESRELTARRWLSVEVDADAIDEKVDIVLADDEDDETSDARGFCRNTQSLSESETSSKSIGKARPGPVASIGHEHEMDDKHGHIGPTQQYSHFLIFNTY